MDGVTRLGGLPPGEMVLGIHPSAGEYLVVHNSIVMSFSNGNGE